MGYFSSSSSSKSKQTTTTAPLSGEGQEWDSIFHGLFFETMDQAGYDIKPTEVTKWNDPDKAANIQAQIKTYQDELDKIGPQKSSVFNYDQFKYRNGGAGKLDQNSIRRNQLQDKIFKLNDELNKIGKVTYNDYSINKREDPRVLDAIDKYGADSPQVADARAQIKAEGIFEANTMADVNHDYLTNLKKFISGDLSYTDEQRKQVDAFIGPIKDVINKTADDLFAEAQNTNNSVGDAIGKLAIQIDKTGYDINDALAAASVQIDQSNDTLMGVLTKVNSDANAKASFEFGLMSKQIDEQTARQAALLGLPPGSMSEKNQALMLKSNALKSIELGLAEDASNKALGIQANTEQGKKGISLARIQLAETQGAKKEGVSQMGIGLADSLGQKKEGITAARGNALVTLEQQRQGQLIGAAVGQLPAQIAAGQGGLGFAQNQDAAKLAMTQGLAGPAQWGLSIEEQRRLAESTVTTKNTTTNNPSIGSSIAGIVGGATSAAGSFLGGGIGLSGGGVGGVAQAALGGSNSFQSLPFYSYNGIGIAGPNYGYSSR